MNQEKPSVTRVKDIKEAWQRLRRMYSFWILVGLFSLIPVIRLLGF